MVTDTVRHLQQWIEERHSERGAFDPERPLAAADVEALLEAARWAPSPHNMQNFEILIVDDPNRLDALQKLRADASEEFLKESYRQLSFSPEELAERKTGLLATSFPATWTNPEAWEPGSDYRSQVAYLSTWMREAPLVFLAFRDRRKHAPGCHEDTLGAVAMGCVLENLWLTCTAREIGCQVLTVVTNSFVEGKVKALLGLPEWAQIDFACRFGYPAKPSTAMLRVRRDVAEFCHRNTYGTRYVVAAADGEDVHDQSRALPAQPR